MFIGPRLVHMMALSDAYYLCTFVCMRTTLDLDEDLLRKAMSATQSRTKTAVIEQGLREVIARAARERLASLYGSDPAAKAPPRRRTVRKR
jgi:Arc/MetJ family transcription regulator